MFKPQIFFEEDGGKPTGGSGSGEKTFTQNDVNNIVSRETKSLKEQISSFEQKFNTQSGELEKLLKEKTERDERDLSELQKAQTTIEDLQGKVKEYEPYKEKVEKQTADLEKRVAKALEDNKENLDDDEVQAVNNSPLENRLYLIDKFVKAKSQTPPEGGGKTVFKDGEIDWGKKLSGAKSVRERDEIAAEMNKYYANQKPQYSTGRII